LEFRPCEIHIREAGKSLHLGERLYVANRFWTRFKGLMGQRELPAGAALILSPCNEIHTFFMRFPIDVLYLDKDSRVVKVTHNMQPWRTAKLCRRAHQVLELPAGTLPLHIQEESIVTFEWMEGNDDGE
jgi:uncharacterized protein